MQTLRAVLFGLRLVLSAFALAGWLGPGAASAGHAAGALPPPAAHHGAPAEAGEAGHGCARGHGHLPAPAAGDRDPSACCAAACGPAMTPEIGSLAAVFVERPRRARPPVDACPPGIDPPTLKPPPRRPFL